MSQPELTRERVEKMRTAFDGDDPVQSATHALIVALCNHYLSTAPVAEGDARDAANFNDEFFGLVDALRDWPKLPPAWVLKWLKYDFPKDWERGKEMQRELGHDVIPPKTECEGGAGAWDRITEGKWRAALRKAGEGKSCPRCSNNKLLGKCPDCGRESLQGWVAE